MTVIRVRPRANSNICTSTGGTCCTGSRLGTRRESSGNAAMATPVAPIPPANPSRRLSESRRRRRLRRLAPNDKRIENSLCRASERASRRFARLAQAMISTQSAAPHKPTNSSRDSVVSSSRKVTTERSTFSFSLGYCRRNRAAISRSSLRAWASDTPGLSRPIPIR